MLNQLANSRVMKIRSKLRACENYISNLEEIFKEDDSKEKQDFIDLSLFPFTYMNIKHEKNYFEHIASIVHPWLSCEMLNESVDLSDINITFTKGIQQVPRALDFTLTTQSQSMLCSNITII